MENVWQTALAILASFGGAGIIILTVSKWVANLTAERLLKKADFEYSKQIESLKSGLEQKNYISKVRFDLEVRIYQELSEAFVSVVSDINSLFPVSYVRALQDEQLMDEFYLSCYKNAVESCKIANTAINKNSPFIPENICDLFASVINECKKQNALFGIYVIHKDKPYTQECREDCESRTRAINDQLNQILTLLRERMNKIDVLDQ